MTVPAVTRLQPSALAARLRAFAERNPAHPIASDCADAADLLEFMTLPPDELPRDHGRRDALLCRLHRDWLPNMSLRNAAKHILLLDTQYRNGIYRRDRHDTAVTCPPGIQGKRAQILWELTCEGALPGEETIRKILSAGSNR